MVETETEEGKQKGKGLRREERREKVKVRNACHK